MTVRWKPLLILSGLFLVIAVVGVVAITYTLVPRGAGDILPLARAERAARHYDNALIHYRRALQKDGRNPAIHEEMAAMFGEWADQAPAEKQAELHGEQVRSWIAAANFGKKLKEPRRQLLADALRRDSPVDARACARELVALEPTNVDAHYLLAASALDERVPDFPAARKHLDALVAAKAPAVRIDWIKARLAQRADIASAREEALAHSRSLLLPDGADPVDRMALMRLRVLDVETTTEPAALAPRVQALQAEARALLQSQQTAPARITRLSLLLERVQKDLIRRAAAASDPKDKAACDALVEAIEGDVETIFQKALAGSGQEPDLQIYLTFADHLRFRQKRDQCLGLIAKALATPMATKPMAGEVVMRLHAVAIEAALAKGDDPARFGKAAPHIEKLLTCSFPSLQGYGHLFQGAIELEQSGVAGPSRKAEGAGASSSSSATAQPKLRASALAHLKVAAAQLTDYAEAQAKYGVALVLTQEPNLGRQYLQKALRLGDLDPQDQIWAALSMLQAGYPEEAEPIVTGLLAQVAQGRQPRTLEPTLHLLSGEIHQARRGPADLKLAVSEYEKAVAAGQPSSTPLQLRLAHIDVQLGKPDRAVQRIEMLRKTGRGGPAAERLNVLILLDEGKADEARKALDRARHDYPRSDELVALDATLLIRAGQARQADRILAGFLAADPENIGVLLMRAQVLSELLDDPKEARKLLVNVADRSDNSAPMVQLALLDLRRRDHAAAAATIAKIRVRWKEAAVADLLDAQLAIDQGNTSAAIACFDEALRKDPNNKVVQFWKAQLDSRNGSTEEAAKAFEAIASDRPTKEIDNGLSLMAASQTALATLAMETGDIDGAIHRFEDLRGSGGLGRSSRWQLVNAYASKGEWDAAKKEMSALLDDPKAPPSAAERVRAATLYRANDDAPAATRLLDSVICENPGHPGAVATRAIMLVDAKQYAEAARRLRAAIDASRKDGKEKPPAVFYLMLSAVEDLTPPETDSTRRALAVVDEGLGAQPDAAELIRAKYRLLMISGDDTGALAFVEAKAKGDPKNPSRRLLFEVYRERKDYRAAERVIRDLLTENPKDAQVAASLVKLVASEAVEAGSRGDRTAEDAANVKAVGLIREFRGKFPNDLTFLQADCDLAARRGDMAHALASTRDMDKIARNSISGPMYRARIYASEGRTREEADAYAEALERNPRQINLRLMLGQARLKLGDFDEALRQARMVLDASHDRHDALLLQARALSGRPGPDALVSARREQAIQILSASIAKDPKFTEGYHQKADIQLTLGRRDEAIASLQAGLKAVPEDAAGLAQLIQRLAETRTGQPGATPAELARAKAVAEEAAGRDTNGSLLLACAVGYHKAGQFDEALPWAEKAAARLDKPVVHLNYGDLLLSLAEATPEPDRAKVYFRRAVEQYDLVLKAQANSVESVNNKAWILHTHLGESRAALDLAAGLVRRVDPATLPGEFFDTLGAIQEATGHRPEAEESYTSGLRKLPDHAILNYHMGRLLASDRNRARKATPYLEKALANRGRLSPSMESDVTLLLHKVSGN